jgi:DNA-binding transcriptional ArsR family regulator
MPKGRIYVINSKKQLATLVSAARQEIVDVLAHSGTVSVADLAAALGRPADALYYHLRILRTAGLIREVSPRFRRGKREALFRAVGSELRIDYQACRRNSTPVLSSIVSSMLRLGIRDFRHTIRDESVLVSGKQRELWALRTTGRLAPKELEEINLSIERLTSVVSKSRHRGELYGITVLLTPLRRRRRRAGKK